MYLLCTVWFLEPLSNWPCLGGTSRNLISRHILHRLGSDLRQWLATFCNLGIKKTASTRNSNFSRATYPLYLHGDIFIIIVKNGWQNFSSVNLFNFNPSYSELSNVLRTIRFYTSDGLSTCTDFSKHSVFGLAMLLLNRDGHKRHQ